MPDKIIIGTRGSQLALYQANKAKEELKLAYPEKEIELKIIKTKGDKILDVSLSKIGDKGLFTKELEVELLEGTIDMAVHSLKDMPTVLPDGLLIAAVLKRAEYRDALVSKNHIPLEQLNKTHKIATSSLRRRAALLNYNPTLRIIDIRGNVNTRLKRMEDGYCDAMIMAAAGLQRLNLDNYITQILPAEIITPAVSQGIIGIEVAQHNKKIQQLLQGINHVPTWKVSLTERAFMRTLQGGCQVPVGCCSSVTGTSITLNGFVASVDGKQYLTKNISGNLNNGEELGQQLANDLINNGANEILKNIRTV